MSTDDFKALNAQWEGRTQTQSTTGTHLARTLQAYEHALDVHARMTFSAWIQSLRDRAEFLEQQAHDGWVLAVVRSDVGRFPTEGGGK